MKPFAFLWDILNIFVKGGSLDDGKRILGGKADCLQARIEDVEEAFFSASAQLGKKRKRVDHLYSWVTKGRKLLRGARSLLGHDGESDMEKEIGVEDQRICSFRTWAQLVNVDVYNLIEKLSVHDREADVLFMHTLSDTRGPYLANLIPVRKLFGQVASDAMRQLLTLLRGEEIGRIAIQGIEGIGKTFLMKHLYNSVVKWVDRFDHVFWVTLSDQLSIELVQDAVAAAVKCKLCSDDNVDVRSKKLSDTLEGLGSFVIFLDDVPETQFFLTRVGIPVPATGSKNKLVFTTRSGFVPDMLGCLETLKLDPLSDKEACEFFMNEARISRGSSGLCERIAILLAKNCCGVPRMIVDVATRMRGIDDPCEWRNTLYELRKFGILMSGQ